MARSTAWEEADTDEKLDMVREKLNKLIDFVDEHKHSEEGFPHVVTGTYTTVGGSL